MPLAEYRSWEYGSQIFLVGFYSYAVIVWTLKFNMLFFYRRLVRGLWVERVILPVFILVGACAVAVILTFTLTCIPFSKFWQVFPDPGGWFIAPSVSFAEVERLIHLPLGQVFVCLRTGLLLYSFDSERGHGFLHLPHSATGKSL